MNTNSRKVLDMLAEGKISADEAEKLLQRLAAIGDTEAESAEVVVTTGTDGTSLSAPLSTGTAADRSVPENPKFLRILVRSSDGDRVNVRVPMALIRTGIKFGALLPKDARGQLEQSGVDLAALSELDPAELVRALAALTVDVDSADGDQVRIFCE
jgi:hypothetical protein